MNRREHPKVTPKRKYLKVLNSVVFSARTSDTHAESQPNWWFQALREKTPSRRPHKFLTARKDRSETNAGATSDGRMDPTPDPGSGAGAGASACAATPLLSMLAERSNTKARTARFLSATTERAIVDERERTEPLVANVNPALGRAASRRVQINTYSCKAKEQQPLLERK
ncbi:hypothetical protein AXG93_4316s1580 [Marchantia polymorpha subsp. ruderalis]|uniref:Uncharacterized protein n=1 Tax=Marchantia polymorpha subsp. ruderalis TaxID=1480154 RepID=A0A176VTA5_MARPO|nr:hypothetical protein AXG93_4316s1580 [Marchantia polymorpha subsp. ruderalis]